MNADTDIIIPIVIVLACAIAVLFVGQRMRLPLIIGYFLTGIIVGPYGFQLVTDEQVSMLSEFGIILLMFTIGLEMSFQNLIAMKKIVLIGGTLQLAITSIVVWLILVAFGVNSSQALFIGFLFAHSSTAVIMSIYQNAGVVNSQYGKISLGLLIYQDLNVIPMMMMVPLLASGSSQNIMGELSKFFIGLIILLVILAASIYLVPRFLTKIAMTRNKDLFIISIVVICFGIAWIMSLNGVSLALGAFLAGIAISESDYCHEVIGQILPFRNILTSFFFVSVGMMLKIEYNWNFALHMLGIIGIAVIILFGKSIINYISVRLIGISSSIAILSALGLSQIGEFSFILGQTGLNAGIISDSVYQSVLAITIITMTLTPFIVLNDKKIAKRITESSDTPVYESTVSNIIQQKEPQKHVIIVGYGLCGKLVSKALKIMGIPYNILELNAETVKSEKKLGENIIYGDATRDSILKYAGIDEAKTIVITIPDMESIRLIISHVRNLNPHINIVTRSRFVSDTHSLFRMGADEIVVDEKEVSLKIFKKILVNEHLPEEEVDQYICQIRNELYDKYINVNTELNT
ncbi:MAG TPA: cation:proton antiporter, partial [Methanocorpusculum sp.]|nr:cation:proton antiporter [Methanocorpusculum sp.]